jgi:peptide/nickel transport system ATP-binding protein
MKPPSSNNDKLLQVSDLKVHFTLRRKHPFAKPSFVRAVDDVSFTIPKGSTFGLVGESGCGKTTTALAITRLVPVTSGRVTLGDTIVTELQGEALRLARRRMQIIFQDPYSSLNPRARAGTIVCEPLNLMNILPRAEHEERVAELFQYVGLRPEQKFLFPHQFSGGQRQRIVIARALASQPDLIVCDEPVSALDVAIQAQILNLLRKLQRELGLTYLFISHDMGVIQHMCDEIAVMYLGTVVEQADRSDFFKHPLHPYTWALLSAVPSADPKIKTLAGRIKLEGDPPSPIDPPAGCRFASRCPFPAATCRKEMPLLRDVDKDHLVACHIISNIEDAKVLQRKAAKKIFSGTK